MVEKGIRWMADKQAVHARVDLEYRPRGDRVGDQSFKVRGWLGHTKVEPTDEAGFKITSHVSDFLVRSKDLPVTPTPGDEVFRDGFCYEVLDLSGDAGCWCWSDPFQTVYRIHVKNLGKVK